MTDRKERWQRVEQIFQTALELPPPDRGIFLRDACSEDEELRREVEGLLAHQSAAVSFLEAPVDALAAAVLSRVPTSLTGRKLHLLEIGALLGAGGMGEVYRARDTVLRRDVAVKVLPHQFAANAEWLARFEREARILASLNHPHIAQLYQLEVADGVRALVMELVEGETLADRIARGAIALEEALSIASQIAAALETAHVQGIVHRDLKPANVKVRPDGVVKVLDFGLAKFGQSGGGAAVDSGGTTITGAGLVMGTAAYMSPEQVRGHAVDARTDVWALGAVVYEMLTGHRAFNGATTSDTIAAVLTIDPVWQDLPTSAGTPIKRFVRHCLQKEPQMRLGSAALAKQQIDAALRGVRSRARSASGKSRPLSPDRVTKQGNTTSRTTSYSPLSFESGGNLRPVWSPDGKAVAFAAAESLSEPYQVYVRYLDAQSSVPITRLPLDAIPVSWTRRGQILFETQSSPAGLWSVSQTGGPAAPFLLMDDVRWHTTVEGGAVAHYDQQSERAGLWISDPAGSPYTRYTPATFDGGLARRGVALQFSPDGRRLLLMRDRGRGLEAWLLPYPADPDAPPRRVLEEALPDLSRDPHASWFPDGRRLVLAISAGFQPSRLYIADTVVNTLQPLSSGTTAQMYPAVSPDGERVAFTEHRRDFNIIQVDVQTGRVKELISTRRNEDTPAWALHSEVLAYVTDRTGAPEVWMHQPGRTERPIVTDRDFPSGTTQAFMSPSLSPDGTRVIFCRGEADGMYLWMSSVSGGSPIRLTDSVETAEHPGGWSPDGKWFVYLGAEGGTVSVRRVLTTGRATSEVLVPPLDWDTNGFALPTWSPDNQWILYNNNGWRLLAPDGATERELGLHAAVCTFSRDSSDLYYVRRAARGGVLATRPVVGGPERVVANLAEDQVPRSAYRPALRMTFSPHDQFLTFSAAKSETNLWLLQLKAAASRGGRRHR